MESKRTIPTLNAHSLILLICLIITSYSFGQNKFIILSKQKIHHIDLLNKRTGEIINVKSFIETGGNFLIECKDLINTYLVSDALTAFKLFKENTHESTTWIVSQELADKSLTECFDKYKTKNEVSQKPGKFMVSNYIGSVISRDQYKVRSKGKNQVLNFSPDNHLYFLNNEEIRIGWSTQDKIDRITIYDVTDEKQIWSATDFADSSVNYDKIKNDLQSPLKSGHDYEMEIILHSSEIGKQKEKKFVYEFKLRPLVFDNLESTCFLSADLVYISWKTNQNITKMYIKNIFLDKTIWESDNYNLDILSIKNLKNKIKSPIQPKTHYQLIIDLEDKNKNKIQCMYNFEVVMTKEEYIEFSEFIK